MQTHYSFAFHGTSKCLYNLKKINNYIIKFPLVIQEMHNDKKNVDAHPWHPKIKAHNASITCIKNWRYEHLFSHFLATLGKRCSLKWPLMENWNKDCLKINLQETGGSTFANGTIFLAINNTISSSKTFVEDHFCSKQHYY